MDMVECGSRRRRIAPRMLAQDAAGAPIRGRPRRGLDRWAAKLAAYHQQPMALLIASDLHIDMAGQPLLRGVSFKLERRERMTLAGRNGAGKTTLLRTLAGETSIDRGELSVARGMRIALHDQRPPLAEPRRLVAWSCASTSCLAARRSCGSRPSWPSLSRAWPPARRTSPRSRATPARKRVWRRAAATCGAIARLRWRMGSGSPTPTWTAPWTRSPEASSRAPR